MKIGYREFKIIVIVLSVLAVALFPVWPYVRWGYFPSLLLAVIVAFMFLLQKLARD